MRCPRIFQIIVKNGSAFTAPRVRREPDRPDGDTGSYFMWPPEATVNSTPPYDNETLADVDGTDARTAPTYTVTLNAGNGTINSGNVTSYTYGVGA